MNSIVLFDPSYGTSNLGDHIINESIMQHMSYVFNSGYLIRYGTHNPLLHVPQMLRKNEVNTNCSSSNLKFIGGTNIIKSNLLILTPGWNVNIVTVKLYTQSVCIGAGLASEGDNKKPNAYTRAIYRKAFSGQYIHSVRDDITKKYLDKLGIKAINTGCPTLWSLNKEFCKSIPRTKADKVIFTLTDYKKDPVNDQKFIDLLMKNYKQIYFWVQGSEDLNYLETLRNTKNIILVKPNLPAYKSLLEKGGIDYVGTRLHAGIYAMQHKVRSIILIVDNRARDMHDSYNINAIERGDIESLRAKINSSFATEIKIDEEKIKSWKAQFKEFAN